MTNNLTHVFPISISLAIAYTLNLSSAYANNTAEPNQKMFTDGNHVRSTKPLISNQSTLKHSKKPLISSQFTQLPLNKKREHEGTYRAKNSTLKIAPSNVSSTSSRPVSMFGASVTQKAGQVYKTGKAVVGAPVDFLLNYQNMREANTIGADKYFHCKANCEATRRGPSGENTARHISNLREWTDQKIKGDPTDASEADQEANHVGRKGAKNSQLSCKQVCIQFRPKGLPTNY